MREIVTVQVGQAGNQIGRRFWLELAGEAHQPSRDREGKVYEAATSAFFRNVDCAYEPFRDLGIGSAIQKNSLKARAVLVDSEESVVNETARDPRLGSLFERRQCVTEVSGAGNNWAHGYCEYGKIAGDRFEDAVRIAMEACDTPQGFCFLFSVGGGTGSGLGSYCLEAIADLYPELGRFCVPVYPSANDDVVTSPYNALLATTHMLDLADCIVPIENQALTEAAERAAAAATTTTSGQQSETIKTRSHIKEQSQREKRKRGFDAMNDVAAQFVSDLTSGTRYRGDVNMDLNDIATNLVPYPRLNFLTASFAPCVERGGLGKRSMQNDSPERLFEEATSPRSRLVRFGEPRPRALAVALMARGDIVDADVFRATTRLRPKFKLPSWNPEGFKIGLCSVPPLRAPRSVLCLCNATDVVLPLTTMRKRFSRLYDRRAMLHHYEQYTDLHIFEQALNDFDDLIHRYSTVSSAPASLYQPKPQSELMAKLPDQRRLSSLLSNFGMSPCSTSSEIVTPSPAHARSKGSDSCGRRQPSTSVVTIKINKNRRRGSSTFGGETDSTPLSSPRTAGEDKTDPAVVTTPLSRHHHTRRSSPLGSSDSSTTRSSGTKQARKPQFSVVRMNDHHRQSAEKIARDWGNSR